MAADQLQIDRAPVSDHAVIRYCERVLDMKVNGIVKRMLRELGRKPSNRELAETLANAHGAALDKLREEVLPRPLWTQARDGVRLKLTTIRLSTHICKLQDGLVTTVFDNRRKPRFRVLSEREQRQASRRAERRARR